jgi:hypothetical protein
MRAMAEAYVRQLRHDGHGDGLEVVEGGDVVPVADGRGGVARSIERDAAGVRAPEGCRSHGSGHHAHWVQWSCGGRRPEQQQPGTVLAVDPADDAIVVDLGDRTVRLHHHEPDRVRDIVAAQGPQVRYQPQFSLLWFETYLVSVSTSPVRPCRFDREVDGATVAPTTKDETAARLRRAITGDP